MKLLKLGLAVALLAAGCGEKDDDDDHTGSGTDSTIDDGATPTADEFLTLDCYWDDGGLYTLLSGGDAAGYNLGLAETDCGGDCWTGEDCLDGYTAADGTIYAMCHKFGADGGFLLTVDNHDEVAEGSTTLHRTGLNNTYFLEEVATGDCWSYGHNPARYVDIGCVDAGPGCTGDNPWYDTETTDGGAE